MPDLVLYHADLSPCAHKVRFVLEERGIAYAHRLLNLMAKDNLKPEYLAIKPYVSDQQRQVINKSTSQVGPIPSERFFASQ